MDRSWVITRGDHHPIQSFYPDELASMKMTCMFSTYNPFDVCLNTRRYSVFKVADIDPYRKYNKGDQFYGYVWKNEK
jgi:hypothetical protein